MRVLSPFCVSVSPLSACTFDSSLPASSCTGIMPTSSPAPLKDAVLCSFAAPVSAALDIDTSGALRFFAADVAGDGWSAGLHGSALSAVMAGGAGGVALLACLLSSLWPCCNVSGLAAMSPEPFSLSSSVSLAVSTSDVSASAVPCECCACCAVVCAFVWLTSDLDAPATPWCALSLLSSPHFISASPEVAAGALSSCIMSCVPPSSAFTCCSEGSARNLSTNVVEQARAKGNLNPPACIDLNRSTIDRDSKALGATGASLPDDSLAANSSASFACTRFLKARKRK
mmetsp:Transcript_62900/g.92226  ORF Transcript_62900/g.92226 Transcript_62900/m.92226 type:complete len:286 (+) Transcript_62900:966-1823(+)